MGLVLDGLQGAISGARTAVSGVTARDVGSVAGAAVPLVTGLGSGPQQALTYFSQVIADLTGGEGRLGQAAEGFAEQSHASSLRMYGNTVPTDISAVNQWIDAFYQPQDVAQIGAQGIALGQKAGQAAIDQTTAVGDANAGRMQKIERAAVETTQETAVSLNALAAQEFNKALTTLDPTWRERVEKLGESASDMATLTNEFMTRYAPGMVEQGVGLATAVNEVAARLLAGEVPDDVAKQISRRSAETAQAFGIMGKSAGGAARALEARDLGLTSLSLIMKGIAVAPQGNAMYGDTFNQLAGIVSAPLAAGAQYDQLLRGYMSPQADVGALYQNTFGAGASAGLLPAASVYQGAINTVNTQIGMAGQVSESNAEQRLSIGSFYQQQQNDWLAAQYTSAKNQGSDFMAEYGGLIGSGVTAAAMLA